MWKQASIESTIGSPFAYLMRDSTSLPNEDATTDTLSIPPTDSIVDSTTSVAALVFLICWTIYAIVLIIKHVFQTAEYVWKLKTTYARVNQGEEAC